MTSRAPRLLRWGLWLACLLVACYALWLLARSDYDDTFDRPIWTLLAADAAMGLVLYVSPGCLDPRRLPSRLSASVVPGASAVVSTTRLRRRIASTGADPDTPPA